MCEPSIVLSARCILYLGSNDPDVFSSELSARLKLHDGAGTVRLRAFRWSFNLATVTPCENLSLSSSYFRAYSFAPLNHIRPHKNIASESLRIKLPSYALFVYLSFSSHIISHSHLGVLSYWLSLPFQCWETFITKQILVFSDHKTSGIGFQQINGFPQR